MSRMNNRDSNLEFSVSKSDGSLVIQANYLKKECTLPEMIVTRKNMNENQEGNNVRIEESDIQKTLGSTSITSVAQRCNGVLLEKKSDEVGKYLESENSESSNFQQKKYDVTSVLVQTEAPGSIPRSPVKQKDEATTTAGSSLESIPFECANSPDRDTCGDCLISNNFYKAVESESCKKRHFVLHFQNTDQKLLLHDSSIIDQFEYFSGITDSDFAESRSQTIEMSKHLPYELARLVLQQEGYILNSTKKTNVCRIIEALDYLGFKYTDEFIGQLYRKIHRHRWIDDRILASMLISTCAYSNIGIDLLMHLKRISGIMSELLSKKGGQLISEMFYKNFDKTICLLTDICHSLCYWRPNDKDVIEFIIEATQQETLVDAFAVIWGPTNCYSTEKKKMLKDASADGPHQVGDADIELYADSDNHSSTTTVNICMSGDSPLDGATELSQVMNLGIYASPRKKATHVYTCFTAQAKFKLKDMLLGEAAFDLYPDGVKAFCPVVSGGPRMHGLQVTCRVEDKIKELKDEFRNRYNLDIDNQKIDDISVELKSRQFPFRSLCLYLLHNAMLRGDLQFISLFSSALHNDVCEWLATYLTPLWVQQCFPDSTNPNIALVNLNSIPSPFVLLHNWFSHYRIPIDAWCSKTIMGELLKNNHFQPLLLRHFYDCLNFIKSCKKWIDSESWILFREKFIEFVTNKPNIVGAVLFDSSIEANTDENSIIHCWLYDEESRQRYSKSSGENYVYQYSSNKLCTNDCNKMTAPCPICQSFQEVTTNSPKQSCRYFGDCATYNNSCSLQVRRKPRTAIEDPFKHVVVDITNDLKEVIADKPKRCKLC